MRKAHGILLVKNLKGRDLWMRNGCRPEDKVKMNIREINFECADWTELAHDRVQWWVFVKTVP
jgi:hypothetical protein